MKIAQIIDGSTVNARKVESRRHRASTCIVGLLCLQLVKTTLGVTCSDFQRRQRRCAVLIAEWVGQPFYCRWRTNSNYSHQIALKYCVLTDSSCNLLCTYVRRDCIRRSGSQMNKFWMLTLNSSTFFLWPTWLFIVADMVVATFRLLSRRFAHWTFRPRQWTFRSCKFFFLWAKRQRG